MTEKLNEVLKAQLEIAEKGILDIEADIEKARRIGLDTTALEKDLSSQKSQIKLVRDVYGL